MELNLRPETESRVQDWMNQTGRPAVELIEDALAGYLEEVAEVRTMLASRYEDYKSGKTTAISAQEALERLRRKSDERRARG